jgi:hypothetical protein
VSAKSPNSGALHSRLFQASAAAALAVIILGLGYLGTRGYSLGANRRVRKPVDFAEFQEAVRLLGIYWLMTNQPLPERQTA